MFGLYYSERSYVAIIPECRTEATLVARNEKKNHVQFKSENNGIDPTTSLITYIK